MTPPFFQYPPVVVVVLVFVVLVVVGLFPFLSNFLLTNQQKKVLLCPKPYVMHHQCVSAEEIRKNYQPNTPLDSPSMQLGRYEEVSVLGS
jgi:hypothetical protein